MSSKILYVIPFKGSNIYRKNNLKTVLTWIKKVKSYLFDNYHITLDICVIEQGSEPWEHLPKDDLIHIFINNTGTFNKGWSFNVAVKHLPNYQYYGFADADIVVPEIDKFCEYVVECSVVDPKVAFRPFKDRFDTTTTQSSMIHTYTDIDESQLTLTKHGGLSFASNMIFMSSKTYEEIGGWDEIFRGWGRYDDFITHKLSLICHCNNVLSNQNAIHLWHPVTMDFSLSQHNVDTYNLMIKYTPTQLLESISNGRKTMGNSDLYTSS